MAGEIEHIKGKGFDKHPENINRKGRPPVLPPLKEAIAKILAEEKDGLNALEAILKAIRAKAIKGDTTAAKTILERAYGLPKQTIDVSTQQNTPIIQVASKDDKKALEEL